ncbi:hypothetical protein ACFL26_02100 [Patescibacteria group bacterium]
MGSKLLLVDRSFCDRGGLREDLEVVCGLVINFAWAGEATVYVYGVACGQPFDDADGRRVIEVGPLPDGTDPRSVIDCVAAVKRVPAQSVCLVPF